ncbi:flagellar export chaperone FlgN [Candidatus Latescibacterota bacterium]
MNGESHVTELISIQHREIRTFTALAELLIIEEKALVECDNNLLLDVLGRQEDVLSSIACLEKSRMEVVSRIAESFGLDSETVTVSQIADRVEQPQKRELGEVSHVLMEIQENLRQKKNTNVLLIRQGITMVENNLRYLVRRFGKGNTDSGTYSAQARTGAVTGSIGVDGRL